MVVSKSEIAFSRTEGAIIAVDTEAGFCYAMNATAARVWELIAGATPVSTICQTLCNEFDVEPETCRQEVMGILAEMSEAGLVKWNSV